MLFLILQNNLAMEILDFRISISFTILYACFFTFQCNIWYTVCIFIWWIKNLIIIIIIIIIISLFHL